jgi:hypothetical protein
MKRRQRNIDPTVSLFPFLTVLICTIGMLIVLLVISVRAVGTQAHNEAEKETADFDTLSSDVQDQIELHQLRSQGWLDARASLVEKVQAARLQRSFVQEALRELEDDAKILAAQLKLLLETPDGTVDQDRSERAIAELRRKIELAEAELASISDVASPTVYNLVPHDGPNGTHRRPIYVECTNRSLIIRPLDIELPISDFAAPSEPGNPLDAALTTIREYWVKYQVAGGEGEPYPLLVVRPSGAQAFTLARRAMTSWVDEFGYELIEDEKQINFGQNDPQLAGLVRDAVSRSLEQQRLLAIEIRARERALQQRTIAQQVATGAGGMRADRVNGGFVSGTRVNLPADQHDLTSDDDRTFKPEIETAKTTTKNSTKKSEGKFSEDDSRSSNISQSNPNSDQAGNSPFCSASSPTPLAQKRGVDWALPSKSDQRATAYLRPVRVFCSKDKLVLDPGPNSSIKKKIIPMNGSTLDAVEPLVASIWRLIDSWGPTPENGHWKPELRFSVLHGGRQRMQDLRSLMQNSGISISGESP